MLEQVWVASRGCVDGLEWMLQWVCELNVPNDDVLDDSTISVYMSGAISDYKPVLNVADSANKTS